MLSDYFGRLADVYTMAKRIITAVILAVPGILLAFLAKPLNLGEEALLFGLFLAFVLPITWLVTRTPDS